MARDFEALELCRLVTVACTVCTTCQDTASAIGRSFGWSAYYQQSIAVTQKIRASCMLRIL